VNGRTVVKVRKKSNKKAVKHNHVTGLIIKDLAAITTAVNTILDYLTGSGGIHNTQAAQMQERKATRSIYDGREVLVCNGCGFRKPARQLMCVQCVNYNGYRVEAANSEEKDG
jgi:hypothetical protein